MTEKEKKAIERINKRLTIEKYTKNIGTPVYISDLKILLNLLEKKEKIIEEMATYFCSGLSMCEDCEKCFEAKDIYECCKQCIKQYFEREVK